MTLSNGRKAITLFCDGAARGNPGPGACGYVLYDGEKEIDRQGESLGVVTNNVAEYEAVIRGLKKCIEHGASEVVVKSDSELLIRQLNGQYRVRAPHLVPLFTSAKELIRKFKKSSLVHVRREQNKLADRLCNDVLDGVY